MVESRAWRSPGVSMAGPFREERARIVPSITAPVWGGLQRSDCARWNLCTSSAKPDLPTGLINAVGNWREGKGSRTLVLVRREPDQNLCPIWEHIRLYFVPAVCR